MNKKVIDLITFHRANNYGAVLQSYASVVFFENLGYEVNVIDYIPKYLQGFGTFKNTYNQVDNRKHNFVIRLIYSLIKTPSNKKIRCVFDNFINDYLNLTETYISIEQLCKSKPKADFYCSGSDQIWNNYYTGLFDDAFFLNFLNHGEKCISFASSFGRDDFNSDEKKYIKNSLKKYSILTVREEEGKNLLNQLKLNNSSVLFDPTILVDSKVWYNFLDDDISSGKYILVYELHGDSDVYLNAIKFARRKKLKVIKIITMYHHMRFGCKNVLFPSVSTFLNLINNAEYVFTDSFHGTVFSLIFKKKIGVRLPVRFSNRITSFLNLIDSNAIIIEDLNLWEKQVTSNYVEKKNKIMYEKRDIFQKDFIKLFLNLMEGTNGKNDN